MCEKAAGNCFFARIHVYDQHKTQQMREKVIQKIPGMLQFIPSRYKTSKFVKKQLIFILMH